MLINDRQERSQSRCNAAEGGFLPRRSASGATPARGRTVKSPRRKKRDDGTTAGATIVRNPL